MKAYSIIEVNVPFVHELIMEAFISLLLPWQQEKNAALGQSLLFLHLGVQGQQARDILLFQEIQVYKPYRKN